MMTILALLGHAPRDDREADALALLECAIADPGDARAVAMARISTGYALIQNDAVINTMLGPVDINEGQDQVKRGTYDFRRHRRQWRQHA